MATKQQRQRRLKRRRDHQIKTRKVLPAVQKGGVVHIFPHQEAAIKAFAEAKELTLSIEMGHHSRIGESRHTREFLEERTMNELRGVIAVRLNIKGRSKMKKAELIDAILEAQK